MDFRRRRYSASDGYEAEYQAVYDAMTTPPTEAHAIAQNAFVIAAKANGYWTIFDTFYFFAQDTNGASEALINWVNPGTFDATLENAPTFTTLEGFTGNGSGSNNARVCSNWNASTNGVNFVQNSASMGFYNRVDVDENKPGMGSYNSVYTYLLPRVGNNAYLQLNSNSSFNRSTVSNGQGLFVGSREGAALTQIYQNGATVGANNANASVAPISATMYFLARTNSGSSNNQVSMGFTGGALTATQVANFATDFEVLMDAIGKGVIA